MAILGKRKSRQDGGAPAVSKLDAAEIFRRHFEVQFEPLEVDGSEEERTQSQREQDDDNDDDDDDDDDDEWAVGGKRNEEEDDGNDSDSWVGLSDEVDHDEELNGAVSIVEVVDHSKPQVPKEAKMSKKELKAFMVCHFILFRIASSTKALSLRFSPPKSSTTPSPNLCPPTCPRPPSPQRSSPKTRPPSLRKISSCAASLPNRIS